MRSRRGRRRATDGAHFLFMIPLYLGRFHFYLHVSLFMLLLLPFSGIRPRKTELRDSLRTHTKKVDSIKNVIWQTGLRNNNISSTMNALGSGGTREFLNATIEASRVTSDQMREVRREAMDISSDVFKLKMKLASLEPQWSVKFGLAEENGKTNVSFAFFRPFYSSPSNRDERARGRGDVDAEIPFVCLVSQSLRNIKDARNTFNNIEAISAKNEEKFRQWNQTLSLSLQELRDKIAKARHIADGVSIIASIPRIFSLQLRSYQNVFFPFASLNLPSVA